MGGTSSMARLALRSQAFRQPLLVLRLRRRHKFQTPRALHPQHHLQLATVASVGKMGRLRIATISATNKARLNQQAGVQKARQIAKIVARLLGAKNTKKAALA